MSASMSSLSMAKCSRPQRAPSLPAGASVSPVRALEMDSSMPPSAWQRTKRSPKGASRRSGS